MYIYIIQYSLSQMKEDKAEGPEYLNTFICQIQYINNEI